MIIKNLEKFETEKELFDHLVSNEEEIFAQAKMEMKCSDGIGAYSTPIRSEFSQKSSTVSDLLQKDSLELKLAINTTNILDSHGDVHINGLWNKSLKENRRLLHLQEHKRSFDAVISKGSNLKAYTESLTWKSLGFDMEGSTEVLTFDSNVTKNQNEYMFEQYAKGNVDEHSVGMVYVKMVTCINDEDYPTQKENYDKYSPMIANKEALEGTKYFWAVLEAKCVEGSSVLMGSNSFTPTQSVKQEIYKSAVEKWLLQ